MGPQVPAVVARMAAAPRDDEIHHVDHAVAVGVILAVVDRAVDLLERGGEDAAGIVGLLRRGLGIVYNYRAHHVEVGSKVALGVLVEVVVHAAGAVDLLAVYRVVVASIAVAVYHVVKQFSCVAVEKRTVFELHQHHEAVKLAYVPRAQLVPWGLAAGYGRLDAACGGQCRLAHTAQVFLVAGCAASSVVGHDAGGLYLVVFDFGIHHTAFLVPGHCVAVDCSGVVEVLIAVHDDGHARPVGLGDSLRVGKCRDGSGREHAHCQEQ